MTTTGSTTNFDVRCREVLAMWLRWNEASQQINERMFNERDDPNKLRELLDEIDRLRQEAVAASQQLLES